MTEVLDDTLALAAGCLAVAVRLTLDQFLNPDDDHIELREFFGLVGEKPDLWDLVVGGMGKEPGSSRFDKSSNSVEVFRLVKSLTTKPIVGVGFIGTAASMASILNGGVLDLIGSARASIADPFLPTKILEGRERDIIRCIKCNICIATEQLSSPIKCTQNPSFGEERARGWLPNVYVHTEDRTRIAIIGAGPAGLEAACVLGKRGYQVSLYEIVASHGRAGAKGGLRCPAFTTLRYIYEDRLRLLEQLANVELNRALTGLRRHWRKMSTVSL